MVATEEAEVTADLEVAEAAVEAQVGLEADPAVVLAEAVDWEAAAD